MSDSVKIKSKFEAKQNDLINDEIKSFIANSQFVNPNDFVHKISEILKKKHDFGSCFDVRYKKESETKFWCEITIMSQPETTYKSHGTTRTYAYTEACSDMIKTLKSNYKKFYNRNVSCYRDFDYISKVMLNFEGRNIYPGINLIITTKNETLSGFFKAANHRRIPVLEYLPQEDSKIAPQTVLAVNCSSPYMRSIDLEKPLLDFSRKYPNTCIILFATKSNSLDYFGFSTFVEGREYA